VHGRRMLVIAAPGQGAQAPGFLAPWLDLPGFAERLGAWSQITGRDLIRLGTVASADEITDTAVAQPLLLAASLAAAEVLSGGLGQASRLAGAAAGHSVGELAAGVVAGTLSAEDALLLVKVRGNAMARAAAAEPTGMTAVLGGDEATVLAAIDKHHLTPANINGAGQIVAAGTLPQLAAFAADPPAGARLRPLQVAGAFHTAHMAPAADALREAAASVTVADPVLALLSNRDGCVVRTGTDWLERIVSQVTMVVRWDKCMHTMASLGATALIELPPAGALTGLARRALPGMQLVSLKTPDNLDAAQALIAEHADSHADSHAPDWRLLVAPLAGTFRACPGYRASAAPGAAVSTGAELGHVEMRGGNHLITLAFPATIIEWLVEDGDPVSTGQPLVRLQPDGSE
jgi:[acyl-carrier-protein] S-malonyltransferase